MNRRPKKEMKEPTNWKTASLVMYIMYKPELVGKERLIIIFIYFFSLQSFHYFQKPECASLCLNERTEIWAVTAECTEQSASEESRLWVSTAAYLTNFGEVVFFSLNRRDSLFLHIGRRKVKSV